MGSSLRNQYSEEYLAIKKIDGKDCLMISQRLDEDVTAYIPIADKADSKSRLHGKVTHVTLDQLKSFRDLLSDFLDSKNVSVSSHSSDSKDAMATAFAKIPTFEEE